VVPVENYSASSVGVVATRPLSDPITTATSDDGRLVIRSRKSILAAGQQVAVYRLGGLPDFGLPDGFPGDLPGGLPDGLSSFFDGP